MNKHAISDPDQNFFSREYFGFPGERLETVSEHEDII